jgi:Rrf2 family protein
MMSSACWPLPRLAADGWSGKETHLEIVAQPKREAIVGQVERTRQYWDVHIPAKADYGVRALLTLSSATTPRSAETLANEQGLPARFLGAILNDLRRAGLVSSQRGRSSGYLLARPASDITIAEVIRALVGPLAEIRGQRPEDTTYDGAAEHLQDVWVAVRAALRGVLEHVSLEQVATGKLPKHVTMLTGEPDAWLPR